MKRYLLCPSCGCALTCVKDVIGQKVRCGDCNTKFVASEYSLPPSKSEKSPSSKLNRKAQEFRQSIPQERMWVGSIMGLILFQIEESGARELAHWTIVIDEDRNEPYLICGKTSGGRRKIQLHECPSFSNFRDFVYDPTVNEMICQDLAFEICRRIEPRWDEISSSR